MSDEPVFGQLISQYTIELAAVATLTKWLWPTYIQEVEDQHNVPRGDLPQPGQIYGASDSTVWEGVDSGSIIVVCEQPTGTPERYQSAGYVATYPLQVFAVFMADVEDRARAFANLYASAIAGVIAQQFAKDNPSVVTDVKMTMAPHAIVPDPDVQQIYQGQVEFDVIAGPVVVDTAGPAVPVILNGEAPAWPEVETETLTVTAEQPS